MALLRVAAFGRSGGARQKAGQPVDFEDWIRAELAPTPPAHALPVAAGRLRIHAPLAHPGRLLQAFTAGAAVTFFALGLMAGAPLPVMQILPAQRSQSLPVTSLAVAPVPAPPAEAAATAATTAATPRVAHHRVDHRPGAAPRASTRPDSATRWASSSTGQPRTGAASLSAPRQSRPTR
ncbi:MAG TPA: hypothetical protein VFH00_04100 [Candidatus Nitrosotalea sp.]|nr:hypothetical protein [Candidatus Nitrosotalea sp.]